MIVTGHRHDKQSYCISPKDYYRLGLFSSPLEPLSLRVVFEEIALLLIALQSKSWVGAACSVHKDLVEWHAILEPLRDLQGSPVNHAAFNAVLCFDLPIDRWNELRKSIPGQHPDTIDIALFVVTIYIISYRIFFGT